MTSPVFIMEKNTIENAFLCFSTGFQNNWTCQLSQDLHEIRRRCSYCFLPTYWNNNLSVFRSGYWSITVYGRKHCYRLYTKHFNEAVHWACAIQKIIDTKAPVETPTQLLIRDIEVGYTTQNIQYTLSLPLLSKWKPHSPTGVQSFLCLSLSCQWPHLIPPHCDRT